MTHPLHEKIGKALSMLEDQFEIILDPACAGDSTQHIPLFLEEEKSYDTQICKVDALILQQNKVDTIIEIEESSISPTQICGKFLTSALSRYFIHEIQAGKYAVEGAKFIQVLDDKKLSEGSKKQLQSTKIEEKIRDILGNFGSISEYHIIWSSDLDSKCSQIINIIQSAA